MKNFILLFILFISTLSVWGQSDIKKIYCDANSIPQEFSMHFVNSKMKKDQSVLNEFIDRKTRELSTLKSRYTDNSSISMDTLNKLMLCVSSIPYKSKDYITSLETRLIEFDVKIAKLNKISKLLEAKKQSKINTELIQLLQLMEYWKGTDTTKFINSNDYTLLPYKINEDIKKANMDRGRLVSRLEKIVPKDKKEYYWIDQRDYQNICEINKIFSTDALKLPIPKPLSFGFILSSLQFDSLSMQLINIKASDIISCIQIKQENLMNIEEDINKAEMELNLLMSNESQNQDFKKYITLTVAVLLGLILVAFFGGVLYKSGNEVKAKLISESGLQFITIFVIIIAVILFGIMNILKGSELAAILSAIAGYILGKTAPPKSEKALELELEMLRMEEKKAERIKEETRLKKEE